jgi:hypothetical protein
MVEFMWCLLNSLIGRDILFSTSMLIGIAFFSVLAARAEARMWRTIRRYNGERRALQRQITLGKSHLR